MKYSGLQLAMQSAILTIMLSTTSFAAATDTPATSTGGLQAKIKYCQDCHGQSGQGYRGVLPIPRIAGQTTKYIENQLLAFFESRRDKNVSVNMPEIHSVSPAMRTALSAHFRNLNPEPLGDGPENLVATGKTIYEEGIPGANVPACSGCHGPEAKGKDEIPRLAGQIYPYTIKELTDWSKERGQNPTNEGTAAVMTPVAHSLSQPQIAAIAAYLSYLK